MTWSNKTIWLIWLALTLMMTGYFSYSMTSNNQTVFLPGETTYGHYQIELKCAVCHSDSFGGKEELQKSCTKCHAKELKDADDKHPKAKFTDPRNADRTAILDARYCISCHIEHKPEITREMGVTVAEDVCYLCHFDIAKERKSHAGMKFDSCDNAGCQNYHDNRALYEDYLVKHHGEADTYKKAHTKELSQSDTLSKLYGYPIKEYPVKTLHLEDIDAPDELLSAQCITEEWQQTTHARSGVNCSACHINQTQTSMTSGWIKKPSYKVCEQCHSQQVNGFLASKHGIRLAHQLPPMEPKLAKLPMNSQAHVKTLNCVTCHSDHKFDVVYAAVDACLSCHNDKHSRTYKDSKHFQLWLKATSGTNVKTSGVSCATCHQPRTSTKQENLEIVYVEHNQNYNLRPNEKMLRSVCMNCHGLGFSLNALADKKLIANNFNGIPEIHVPSIDMAKKRSIEKRKEKEAIRKTGGRNDDVIDDGFL